MKRITAIVIMGLPLAVAQLAAAQEVDGVIELEEVVVTATRTEVPRREIAGSVTIIDAEIMEEKHLRTALEALREVPGLNIVQTGGAGGQTSAFLRGTNSDHILVLIDGVQVNSTTVGQFNFADLTTENIERIEILRGPQSTLYGSDALGGVIQIITKKGEGPLAFSGLFEVGSFGGLRETIGVRGSTGKADYSFSAARFDTEGFSKANEKAGNTEKDGYENTTLSSRIGLGLPRNARMEWAARVTDAKSDLDSGFPLSDDLHYVQDTSSLTSSLKLATPVTNWWGQQLTFSLNQTTLKATNPDPAKTFLNSDVDTEGTRFDWQHNFNVGERDRITLGYEYESLRGDDKGKYDETLFTSAGYVFNELRLTPFIINLGLRFDNNNQFGHETTYKTEAAYLVDTTGSKIWAAFGTGFKGPTLSALFGPFGNPALKPEKSRSLEVGLDHPLLGERVRFAATLFQTRFEPLIIFPPPDFAPLNTEASINGIELEVWAIPFRAVTLSAQYTFTDARELETNTELARRPRQKVTGSLAFRQSSNLRGHLDVRHVGQRLNLPFAVEPVRDYTVVNIAGSYVLTDMTEVFARVENLFNQEYEEVAGYGTAGFSAYGGVKLTF